MRPESGSSEIARGTVEETLNAVLEADEQCFRGAVFLCRLTILRHGEALGHQLEYLAARLRWQKAATLARGALRTILLFY
jgi:hypothetical protein